MQVRYIIVKDHEGQRLDNFLLRELRPVPKSRVMQMIRRGEVRVNSKRVRVGLRLNVGDRIRVPPLRLDPTPPKSIPNWLRELTQQSVIYEDEKLIVLNKPPGIAVHAGGSIQVGLIDAIRELYGDERIDLVHRIDKDTSGCVLVARSRVAMLEMHYAFQQRKVEKHYDAIVAGVWPASLNSIDRPLERFVLPNGERRARVEESGQKALTLVSVRDRCRSASWIIAKPVTGRTHQIRVHTAVVGHFILGDEKYSEPTSLPRPPRLMLHASKISIDNELAFESPLDGAFTHYWNQVARAD